MADADRAEGSFAVPMSASSHAETAPLLTRVTEVDGDRAGASIEGRAAGSSWFARVTNSRVAAAMALLLLALVACLGSGSGFKTAALGSGRGNAPRGPPRAPLASRDADRGGNDAPGSPGWTPTSTLA